MKINASILETINFHVSELPFETGGILGSHDGSLIDKLVMDIPLDKIEKPCSYTPNVDFLNDSIQQWKEKGISFMGIFHTHFGGAKMLSCGDKRYINAIMTAMPHTITYLYFPIFVLPERILVVYKAEKYGDGIEIFQDELQLLP
ncbi:MAG: hypothetical protein IJ265_06110 [Oscillospiraceae bacterium]|nr:hypothetical protein [Oscillospiraceae bacterium]